MPSAEALRALLEPLAAGDGYDLEGVEVRPAGRRRLLRVVVDRDGGVDLDGVATLSARLSAALDASDVMGAAPYVLEVTSPGVDRPLTTPRHWRRAVGRLVRVPVDGAQTEGRIAAVDEAGVVLETPTRSDHLAWSRLGPARVEVEFRHDAGESAAGDARAAAHEGAGPWTST